MIREGSFLSWLQEPFLNHSGRLIATGRLALAHVFLVAIWLDPSQTAAALYATLIGYLLLSWAVTLAVWNSWWLDRKLSGFAHGVDIAVFGVIVFLTEGYTSPFFTFSVFLMLSAAIRGGWRRAASTAVVVVPLFLAAGFAALVLTDAEFDLRRFMIRAAYLVVLSLLIVWFGMHQGSPLVSSADDQPGEALAGDEIPAVLELARARTGAQRLLFCWSEREEPWFHVQGEDMQRCDRFGPSEFSNLIDPAIPTAPFIFDIASGKVLIGSRTGKPVAMRVKTPVHPRFAERYGLSAGLVIPCRTGEFEAQLLLTGVPRLCADTLELAEGLKAQIESYLERSSAMRVSEDAAASQARLAIARDLHDGLLQTLAGASLKLESIRQCVEGESEVSAELESLQEDLAHEQQHIRTAINRMRGAGHVPDASARTIRQLADHLSQQWKIDCQVNVDFRQPLPPQLDQELQYLVREAVANAVRHGAANKVAVIVSRDSLELGVLIQDNGSGFPVEIASDPADYSAPWSLLERVQALSGKLTLTSGGSGSQLRITIPCGGGV